MSKTIQIKFGDQQKTFNNWREAAIYTVLQIDNVKKSNKQRILDAIKEFELNPHSGTLVTKTRLRNHLFND